MDQTPKKKTDYRDRAKVQPAVRRTSSRPGKPQGAKRSFSPSNFAPKVEHDLPQITVSFEHTRSTRQRYYWIYDNMVKTEPSGLSAGDTVAVADVRGRFLGSAIYNQNSRIRARLFSVLPVLFDEEYCRRAVVAAVERRRKNYGADNSYRVVFADSDRLPGVIADLIGGVLVVQLLTFAADRFGETIVQTLQEQLSPRATVVRRDAAVRQKEGLPVRAPETTGTFENPVVVEQDGFVVHADLLAGQKTGLFLDQRENRRLIFPYCKNARVLDLFCYVGAWSFSAARAGAREVLGIDVSANAVDLARKGAESNHFENVRFEAVDAFDYVSEKAKEGEGREQFDVVVCDPPAFAKTAQHVNEAIKGYLSLNYRCMKLLPMGGVLATSSCSQHVSIQEFEGMLSTAARNANMQFQVLVRTGQPPDHPVLLGFPETEYLKCLLLQRVE